MKVAVAVVALPLVNTRPSFRWAVLPQDTLLENSLTGSAEAKRCTVCGKLFVSNSNRAKYCPACARAVHCRQKTESEWRRRSGVDN